MSTACNLTELPASAPSGPSRQIFPISFRVKSANVRSAERKNSSSLHSASLGAT